MYYLYACKGALYLTRAHAQTLEHWLLVINEDNDHNILHLSFFCIVYIIIVTWSHLFTDYMYT